jgi:hypothetical protein
LGCDAYVEHVKPNKTKTSHELGKMKGFIPFRMLVYFRTMPSIAGQNGQKIEFKFDYPPAALIKTCNTYILAMDVASKSTPPECGPTHSKCRFAT